MARKKKGRGRRAVNALSPINKQGIKVGTLMTEIGLVGRGVEVYNQYGATAEAAANFGTGLLDLNQWSSKLIWTGVAISLVGKLTGFRKIGLLQLS